MRAAVHGRLIVAARSGTERFEEAGWTALVSIAPRFPHRPCGPTNVNRRAGRHPEDRSATEQVRIAPTHDPQEQVRAWTRKIPARKRICLNGVVAPVHDA